MHFMFINLYKVYYKNKNNNNNNIFFFKRLLYAGIWKEIAVTPVHGLTLRT